MFLGWSQGSTTEGEKEGKERANQPATKPVPLTLALRARIPGQSSCLTQETAQEPGPSKESGGP